MSFIPETSGFGLNNLPWGVFQTKDSNRNHIGVAIGDQVIDIGALQQHGLFSGPILSQKGSSFQKVFVSTKIDYIICSMLKIF
jgi:hypothetical protein